MQQNNMVASALQETWWLDNENTIKYKVVQREADSRKKLKEVILTRLLCCHQATTGPGQCNVCHFYAPAREKVIHAFAADIENLMEAKIHKSFRTLLLVCVDAGSSTFKIHLCWAFLLGVLTRIFAMHTLQEGNVQGMAMSDCETD